MHSIHGSTMHANVSKVIAKTIYKKLLRKGRFETVGLTVY